MRSDGHWKRHTVPDENESGANRNLPLFPLQKNITQKKISEDGAP